MCVCMCVFQEQRLKCLNEFAEPSISLPLSPTFPEELIITAVIGWRSE